MYLSAPSESLGMSTTDMHVKTPLMFSALARITAATSGFSDHFGEPKRPGTSRNFGNIELTSSKPVLLFVVASMPPMMSYEVIASGLIRVNPTLTLLALAKFPPLMTVRIALPSSS